MKKAVFLLCFIIFTIPVTKVNGYGNNQTISYDNYEIIITDYILDGGKGFTIEKTGVNPFYTVVYTEMESYLINGIIEYNNQYVLYGSVTIRHTLDSYESMFIVMDQLGNVVKKEIYGYGDLEEIVGAYCIDNILIFHTIKTLDNDISYIFNNNYFSSYDLSYNFIDTVEIGTEIYIISSNERYILFNYGYYKEYDGAIRDDLTILLPNEIIDIDDGEAFIGDVTIEFLNNALLNNEIISNGIYLDYPGNYKLLYNNAEYNFILKPEVSGVEDNGFYSESISPTVSAGNAMLNNDIFVSGTEISNPGNYELVIRGINEYSESYNFTITSNMEGITNNHTYLEPVYISFSGEGYLNNQFVSSPIELSETGEYILKIKGENNYLETYYFEIDEEVEAMTLVSFIQKFDIFILVIALISGGIILKKK